MSKKTSSIVAMGAFMAPAVQVDAQTGIISNCAVMTVGTTLGHGFSIDLVTLQQVRDLINAHPDGVKVRFKHPGTENGHLADDAGTVVGMLKPTTRIVGESLRGDVALGDYAAALPGHGDARAYLLGIAAANPAAIGLSVVMVWDPERGAGGEVLARAQEVWACDFVGKPAANPNGLLSSKESPSGTLPGGQSHALQGQKGDPAMDPKLKAALVALGLNPKATDEQAQAMLAALSEGKQAELAAQSAAEDAPPEKPGGNPDADADKKLIKDEVAKQLAAHRQAGEATDLVALETKRVNQITQLGALLKAPETAVRAQIAANATPAEARVALLKALGETNAPVPGVISVGTDQRVTALRAAVPEAIALRAGYAKIAKPHELATKLATLSVIDIGRQYLTLLGVDATYLSRPRMAELLLSKVQLRNQYGSQVSMLAESVGDFPALLLDAINKTFRPLYLDAPKTWPQWVRQTSNADFKNINRVALSESPSLVRRDAGGQINYVSLTDGKETYSLAEYTGGIKITRKAMINDDLDAFGRIPQLQSNAAWRAEEAAVYGILNANAALGVDSLALFHSTHTNLVSASAAKTAPSVTALGDMETKLLSQKGPAGAGRLSLPPKFIITPVSLKVSTEQFLSSQNLIPFMAAASGAASAQASANPYAGRLTHIYSPFLDDTSTTVYYLAADYRAGQIDTVEICFLDGEPEPVLRQETDFDTEDVKFAVRHTLAAKAIDFRGLVKNPGA